MYAICGECSLTEYVAFFSKKFIGSSFIVSIKEVRKHPEWKKEYEKLIKIKRVHQCKSCKGKARKGCCPEYSPENRVMIKAITG